MSARRRCYARTSRPLPVYDGKKRLLPGRTYIGFMHGREGSPCQGLKDWGFDGPVVGPIEYFHSAHGCETFMLAEDADIKAHAKAFGCEDGAFNRDDGPFELESEYGCARVGKFWYGDYTIFVAGKRGES